MKRRKFFRRFMVVLSYTMVVAVILLLAQCEGPTKITNPYKDAQRVKEAAEGVYNEPTMRYVDAMFNEIYIAYQKHIDGATAIQFYKLAEPIVEEAGARLDAIKKQQDELAAMEQTLDTMLSNLEKTWNVSTDTADADRTLIEENRKRVDELKAEYESVKALSEEAGAMIWEYWSDQDGEEFKRYTKQQQESEARMVEIEKEIADIELQNTILELAYAKQGVELFPAVAEESANVEVVSADVAEPVEAVVE